MGGGGPHGGTSYDAQESVGNFAVMGVGLAAEARPGLVTGPVFKIGGVGAYASRGRFDSSVLPPEVP
jgi:hypothetical protein